MKLSDLQFENGKLVKIKGHRPEYNDGVTMRRLLLEMGKLVYELERQLTDVVGTYAKYSEKPRQDSLIEHYKAVDKAAEKLGELK